MGRCVIHALMFMSRRAESEISSRFLGDLGRPADAPGELGAIIRAAGKGALVRFGGW